MSDGASRAGDWQAAMSLVERLLDLPPGERQAALRAHAVTAEIRELATRMLAADGQPSMLDVPLGDIRAGDAGPAPDLVGRRMGRWLLTGLLGQGGMSVVYRARSLAPPAGQEAALKLLSMAATTTAGRARFEREIDILVRLRHPGIAPLYDAGVGVDGTPWFAMALVEGIDIATWCREQGLGVAQRVELLLQVCDAVAHAHRHLVIHRDIKPSNVLVDAEGRAILLDFGISRILAEGADEITSTGLYAFTPRYAAPEQIEGGAITTATDVYSLGSLLHLLLLGSAPQFTAGESECIDPATLARREGDQSLRRLLTGDLGAVLGKALARAPERRHPGAAELAADLRAWREGRPVSARRDSGGYRLRRFIARHRVAASLSASLLGAMVAGTWISLTQRAAAIASAERANASEASATRQLAFLRQLLETVSPASDAPPSIPRQRLVEQAEAQARRELHDDPRALASILATLASVRSQAGQYAPALALLDEAERLSPPRDDNPEDLQRAAQQVVIGSMVGNDAHQVEARRRLAGIESSLARLAPGSDAHLYALMSLTGLLSKHNEVDASLATIERATLDCPQAGRKFCASVMARKVGMLWNAGRHADALQVNEALWRIADLEQVLGPSAFAIAATGYARSLEAADRNDEALALLDGVLLRHAEVHERPTRNYLQAQLLKAKIQSKQGHPGEAMATIESAIASSTTLMGPDAIDTLTLRARRAQMVAADGRIDPAVAEVQDLLPRMRAARGDDHPTVLNLTGLLATLMQKQGRTGEAVSLQRDVVRRMARAQPPDSRHLASQRLVLARLLLAAGDVAGADAGLAAAFPAFRNPDGSPSLDGLMIEAERGMLQERLGNREAAVDALRPVLERLRTDHADDPGYVVGLAWSIESNCRGPALASCAALRAEAQAVVARDLPAHRRELHRLATALPR